MATDAQQDKQQPPPAEQARHRFGPRVLGAVLPDVVRPAFRRRSPAVAHLIADWRSVVGPALAAVTVPRRLFSGTLVLSASGPIALELQHLSGELMQRINLHLGRVAVSRLRFVQDMAPAGAAPAPYPPAAPRPVADAAAGAVADLPPGALRDALERLGRAVLTANPPP